MSDYSNSAISEAYEIVRTVEIILASKRTFRLEVVKTEKGTIAEPYHVHVYERQTLYRAPNGSVSSNSVPKGDSFHVWIQDLYIPTYQRSKPDSALSVALNSVVEQRNNENTPW